MSDLRINASPPSTMVSGTSTTATTAPAADGRQVDFTSLVKQSIDEVNRVQSEAGKLAERFERGDPDVDLVRVMVEMQRARVSFEAVSQVRNKLVEAYREVMNMQV